MARHILKVGIKLKKAKGADEIVARRVDEARQLAAQAISDAIAEFVKDLIPRRGGWFDIYREAIVYFSTKDGELWAASGLWPKEYSVFPADTTLLTFALRPGDTISAVLASYNPWTVDRLPSLNGGIQVDVVAKPGSINEVTAHRERLIGAESAIREGLSNAGASFAPGVPTIMGKVYADVAFMAHALEHGLAGLPRLPHWAKTFRRAKNDARQWVAPEHDRIQRILAGKETFSDRGRVMPSQLERKLGL